MIEVAAPGSPLDALETRHPLDPKELRNALGCFGTGVTVITAKSGAGRLVGLTVNSFASVSLDPPLVLWSLVSHSSSLSVFQEASHFTVNVLSLQQREVAAQFARSTNDRFAGIGWREGRGGAPVLDHVVAHFQCRNAYRYYGGDHVIFLGAVESYSYNGEPALFFSRGQFGAFAGED